jgi:uncharacterized protein DUF4288
MPYIPPNRHWYIAELVMQFDIAGEADTLVHVDVKLISADSPDQAFAKAEQMGRDGEVAYQNTDHKHVLIKFRGLRDLFLIYDELGDGAELLYEERPAIRENEIAAMIKQKSALAVFRKDSGDCKR